MGRPIREKLPITPHLRLCILSLSVGSLARFYPALPQCGHGKNIRAASFNAHTLQVWKPALRRRSTPLPAKEPIWVIPLSGRVEIKAIEPPLLLAALQRLRKAFQERSAAGRAQVGHQPGQQPRRISPSPFEVGLVAFAKLPGRDLAKHHGPRFGSRQHAVGEGVHFRRRLRGWRFARARPEPGPRQLSRRG